MAARWLGIDVHEKRFDLAALSGLGGVKTFSKNLAEIESILNAEKPQAIAIDAPSSPNRKLMLDPKIRSGLGIKQGQWQDCRVSEYLLGIGGYFSTKSIKDDCEGWMKAGFELYEHLQRLGYSLAGGESKGSLIEVHPTYGFSWLIAPAKLDKKSTEQGRAQRIKILKKFVPGFIPEKKSSHEIDSALAALLARFYCTKEHPCFWLGDPAEGQILLPGPIRKNLPADNLVKLIPHSVSKKWFAQAARQRAK